MTRGKAIPRCIGCGDTAVRGGGYCCSQGRNQKQGSTGQLASSFENCKRFCTPFVASTTFFLTGAKCRKISLQRHPFCTMFSTSSFQCRV